MSLGHWCLGGEYNENERGWELYDGHGIYLTRVCAKCESEKTAEYRSDIFERYDADEPIEAET